MAKELAKMLLEKAESGDNRSLKDIWAAYRKKEVQVEVKMNKGCLIRSLRRRPYQKK